MSIITSLSAALHSAKSASTELRDANALASPVAHLLLLDLIRDQQRIVERIAALISATEGRP